MPRLWIALTGDQEFRRGEPTGDQEGQETKLGSYARWASQRFCSTALDLLISCGLSVSDLLLDLHARRHRCADSNSGAIDWSCANCPRRVCSVAISRSSAGSTSSALVVQMSLQIGAGLAATRVVSASPDPDSRRPALPYRLADDVHQRAGGQLREMARVGEDVIVHHRIDHRPVSRPARGRTGPAVPRAAAGVAASGVSSHGRRSNRSTREASRPPRAEPASGWPPMKVNAGGRPRDASTVVRLVLPTSVTSAGPRTTVAQPRQHRDVLRDGRRQHDQIGLGQRGQIAAADGERAQLPRHQRHVVAVDADHGRVGKDPAHGKRQRPADQADADDPDAPKIAVSSHGRQSSIVNRRNRQFPSSTPGASPVRGRSSGRWPAR